jgi:hypothetical protein
VPQTSSKYLAAIAALELSNSLQNTAPVAPLGHIGTVQLQALRQLSEIFSVAIPSSTTKHAPQVSQASSQFSSTVHPARMSVLAPPHSGSTCPNNANPVTTPCPVSISYGEPQTGAISKGGTKNEPRACSTPEGESYTATQQCDSPHTTSSISKCPLRASRHGRGESL